MAGRKRWNFDYSEDKGKENGLNNDGQQSPHQEEEEEQQQKELNNHYFVQYSSDEIGDDDDVEAESHVSQQQQIKYEENTRNQLYGIHDDDDEDSNNDDNEDNNGIVEEERNDIYTSSFHNNNNSNNDMNDSQHYQQQQHQIDCLPENNDDNKSEKYNNNKHGENAIYSSITPVSPNSKADEKKCDINDIYPQSQEMKDSVLYCNSNDNNKENDNKSLVEEEHLSHSETSSRNSSLLDGINLRALSERFMHREEESSPSDNKNNAKSGGGTGSTKMMGWGEYDNDSCSIFTNDDQDSNNDNTQNLKEANIKIIIPEGEEEVDIYEGFVSRENFRQKPRSKSKIDSATENSASGITILEEEYDSKRPWRKAPSASNNDKKPQYHQSVPSLQSEVSNLTLTLTDIQNQNKKYLDEPYNYEDVENQDEICLAQDSLTVYENMNQGSVTFFQQPNFQNIVHSIDTNDQYTTSTPTTNNVGNDNNITKNAQHVSSSNEKEDFDVDQQHEEGDNEDEDPDVKWLHQLRPAVSVASNAQETGIYLTGNIANTKFGAKLMEANKKNHDTNSDNDSIHSTLSNNSIGSMIHQKNESQWSKLRKLIDTDEEKEHNKSHTKAMEMFKPAPVKIRTGLARIFEDAAKKTIENEKRQENIEREERQENIKNNVNSTDDEDSDLDNVEDRKLLPHKLSSDDEKKVESDNCHYNDEDSSKGSCNLDPHLAQYDSLQKMESGQDDKHPTNHIKFSFSDTYTKHKYPLGFIALVLIGGIIGVIIISTSSEDDKPILPKLPKLPKLPIWIRIHKVFDVTGTTSLTDDGNTIVYNLRSDKLKFYDLNLESTEETIWTTYPDTNIYIPGNDNCFVKIKMNDDRGIINVKKKTDGLWESYQDGKVYLNISSASITEDCNRLVVGVPTNTTKNGENSGLARVYDVTKGAFDQLGDDIIGKEPGFKTGNSVSISNTGDILAVASPHENTNGIDSGQVIIYQLVDNKKWNKTHTIRGATGDLLGSSLYASHDGKRIAIGSKGYTFNGQVGIGSCRVWQFKNEATWEPMGNMLMGEKEMGSLVSLSGDGNRLFVNDGGAVRIFEWNKSSTDSDPSDWNEVGKISGTEIPYAISASETGHRVSIGRGSPWDRVDVWEEDAEE